MQQKLRRESESSSSFGSSYIKALLLSSLVSVIILGFLSMAIADNAMSAFRHQYIVIPLLIALLIFSAFMAAEDTAKRQQAEIRRIENEATHLMEEVTGQRNILEQEKEKLEKECQIWKATLREKSRGFPTLMAAISDYEEVSDNRIVRFLQEKKHPALKAAETVSDQNRRRREAERTAKVTRSIIEYYEMMAPFLIDLKEDIYEEDKEGFSHEYSEEEREDPVILYVSKEEYRKLSQTERNQLALDRYWQRPKSKYLS